MRNAGLAHDYIWRAGVRLGALDVLFDGQSWADVVRESQEIVELTLKALVRTIGIDPPRVHDVSEILIAEQERLPPALRQQQLEALVAISRELRRDRELAFYGSEDLTPSGFYSKSDAERARDAARHTVEAVRPHIAASA